MGSTAEASRDERRRLRHHPVVATLKTGVFLLFCAALTGSVFFVLTFDNLRPAEADRAHGDMLRLLARLETRIAHRPADLPVRLLTDPDRTPVLPAGPLPRSYIDFLGPDRTAPAARAVADPWNHSYLLTAVARGAAVLLTCVSPGPNGVFETDPGDVAAANDDLCLRRRIPSQGRR